MQVNIGRPSIPGSLLYRKDYWTGFGFPYILKEEGPTSQTPRGTTFRDLGQALCLGTIKTQGGGV